jgi:hypothetical protein
MNTKLFKSRHAIVAAALLLAFVVWSFLTEDWESQRSYRLISGWTALALFAMVLAYVLRKNVHKAGISPEFKIRVPVEKLEAAESSLAELRVLISNGKLTEPAEIMERGKRMLKQEGVQRVIKLQLFLDADGNQILRAVPTDPLGRLARWMHAHLYYGLAAGGMVLLHAGGAPRSSIGYLLFGLTLIVVLTGVGGVFLWAVMPRILTKAERDLSIEKAHALLDSLDRKIELAYESVDDGTRAVCQDADKNDGDFNQRIEAARKATADDPEARRRTEDLMALLGQRRQVRGEWKMLMRIKQRMHIWRVVHLPAAVLLSVVIVVHVVSVLWY